MTHTKDTAAAKPLSLRCKRDRAEFMQEQIAWNLHVEFPNIKGKQIEFIKRMAVAVAESIPAYNYIDDAREELEELAIKMPHIKEQQIVEIQKSNCCSIAKYFPPNADL